MFSNGKRISKSILTVITGLGLSTSAAFAQTGHMLIVQRNFMEEGPVDRSARELFNAGQKFYDQSRYPDAERTFREVIQKYPKTAIAETPVAASASTATRNILPASPTRSIAIAVTARSSIEARPRVWRWDGGRGLPTGSTLTTTVRPRSMSPAGC